LSDIGFFGGLFEFKGYNKPVLVSSVDGVGTKLKIASALAKYDTIGIDLVNHCINDILVCGAEPLFFLDYIAMGKLVPNKVESIVKGLTHACREVGCSLIGGETAEMPGVYTRGDYDLVGFVVGVVEKTKIINGETIALGDNLIGLSSSGLHTNGYSLVRKIFGDTESELSVYYPGLGRTLGEAFLEPHLCYYKSLKPLLPVIKGMAHITGGGLIDNIPRILPHGLAVYIHTKTWIAHPIFKLIQQQGDIDDNEMYHVFNMGIGMVVVCSSENTTQFTTSLPGSQVIGEVVKQKGKTRVFIE
jgi:phosphoribosylformylglycinamidine cyclo-ligase